MALTTKTHWLGVLLLFIASMLILITTISAPIINHAGLLKVTLTNYTHAGNSVIHFGTFGYCVTNVPPWDSRHDWCTGRRIGYNPSDIVTRATDTTFENTDGGTANSLARVMILHPIACGLAFIAFLTTLGGRTIMSSVSGSLVAGLTWILELVSLVVDFTAFGIIRHEVNDQTSGPLPKAQFGNAMWCLVASFIFLNGGMFIIGMSFLGAFKEKRADSKRATEAQAASNGAATEKKKKKRFGIF